MSTIRVVNIQHTDATEPNIVLEADGTTVFASGITISGGTNLTVSGTAEFASGTVSAPGITFIDDNNTGIYEPAADTVAITTAATERLRIDSSGRLLVGDSSIFANANADDLQIGKTTTANVGLTIGSSTQGQLAFGDAGDARAGLIHYQHTDNSMRFYTSGPTNERMRIDSSGNVGIGSSTINQTTSGRTVVGINGSSEALLNFNHGNTLGGFLYASSAEFRIEANSNRPLVFRGNSTERMRIDSGGIVNIKKSAESLRLEPDSGTSYIGFWNGTASAHYGFVGSGDQIISGGSSSDLAVRSQASLVFAAGGSSERMRVLSSGGLTFNGDTATANALDDYEKGTWTLSLTGFTNAGTTTGRVHNYIKIGKVVTLFFDIFQTNNNMSIANNAQITGLPYSVDTSIQFHSAVSVNAYANSQINYVAAYLNSGNEIVITPAPVSNIRHLWGQVSYLTA